MMRDIGPSFRKDGVGCTPWFSDKSSMWTLGNFQMARETAFMREQNETQ
jgi:hypothetical protein